MEKHIKAGNLPTAEEFLKEAQSNPTKGWTTHKAMIEFAKLHVEAALKEAVKHLPFDDKMNQSLLDERAILNSYPLENIK
jgi:hypothetical protein